MSIGFDLGEPGITPGQRKLLAAVACASGDSLGAIATTGRWTRTATAEALLMAEGLGYIERHVSGRRTRYALTRLGRVVMER